MYYSDDNATTYLDGFKIMSLFSLASSEIGLSPLAILFIVIFGGFFLIAFILTSKNMDTNGLLRVLYAKPFRKPDGTVEYRKEE